MRRRWPFTSPCRAWGTTRRERVADWIGDLVHTAEWYARYRVWSPPTRRLMAKPGRGSRWPLPF